MQGDRSEVHDVAQALAVVHDEVVDVASDVVRMDARGPYPRRNPFGRVLLEEGLPLDPIGIPREHERPILQVRQEPRRD